MALRNGDRLGPYEVIGSIGAGGMGEVYLARDTRLGRSVAIKVLAAETGRSPDVRARFEREARTISQLHHPNICTLHDVGREGAMDFLVLEYLEGQTLARRLATGVPPLDETLAIAGQVAEALARAHQAGVVHRDLKPGNIMLVPGDAGRPVVKLLDFGLAGLVHRPEAVAAEELTVAGSGPLTARGTVLGTLPYMAPEQVEGKSADPRSDIWAFGCLLYEMLTGRRPFAGETEAALIGSILERHPPPISDIAPAVPRSLVRLVDACLVKEAAARLQSAQDARLALAWAAASETADARRSHIRQSVTPWIAAAAIAGLIVGAAASAAWLAGSRTSVPSAAVPVNASIALPPGGSFSPFGSNLALSPDGRLLVYTGLDNGHPRLFLRALDSFEARPLPGTEGAETPFFSPDGTQVGFQAGGQLKRVALAGGAPATILDVPSARGAVWLPDDTIVFTPSFNEGLWRIAATGDGSPVQVTTLDAALNERTHRFPMVLPDGRTVLYVAGDTKLDSFAEARVMAQSVDGGAPKLIVRGALAPQYLRSGYLTYYTGASLMAVPFDPLRLETTGPAVVLAEQVAWSKGFGTAHYAAGGDATIAYIPGGEAWPRKSVEWLTRGGRRDRIPRLDGSFVGVRIDPRGGRVVFLEHGANDALWLFDLGREALSRLTFAGSYNQGSWFSSGTQVVTVLGYSIVRLGIDGADPEVLYDDDAHKLFPDVSPDGRRVVFDAAGAGSGSDLMMLDVERRVARPWQAERFIETQPRFSPDGRWIAYVSDESGRFEVFFRSAEGAGGRIQVSTQGGTSPVWSRDGREIFFVSPVPGTSAPSGDLYGVELSETGPGTPRLIVREAWPRPTFVAPLGIPVFSYDLMPDGRFISIQSGPPPVPAQINVIVRGRPD